MKRNHLRRILTFVMVLSLTAGLLPAISPTAKAAGATDPFGISLNGSVDSNLSSNPYGTDGWFSLFTQSELVLSKTEKDGGRTQQESRFTSSTSRNVEKTVGADGGYSLIATAAFDPLGSGRDEYVATLVYHDSDKKLYLYVTNENGQVGGAVAVDTVNFLDEVASYHAMSHMAITAGDYDGNGKDTIVVYAANALLLKEYSWSKGTPSETGKSIRIGDTLGNSGKDRLDWVMKDDNDDGEDELRATPSV